MLDNNKKQEVSVGILFFVGLLLLFLGIFFAKSCNFSASDNLLKIRFPNSGGIQYGEPVVVNGVKRGSVQNVENNNSSVLVSIKLDNYDDIKSDASAKITLLEITGGKKIEIKPGISSEKFNLKNEMIGKTPADLPELVSLIGDVSGDLVSLVKKLDTVASSATSLLADGQVVSDIRNTLSTTNQITQDLKGLISNNTNKIQGAIDNLAILSRDLKVFVDDNKNTLSDIINNADTTLSDTKILISNVENSIKKADELLSNINSMVSDIKTKESLVNKLLYDKEFSLKLDSTLNSLGILVNTIQEHGINVNVRLGSRP